MAGLTLLAVPAFPYAEVITGTAGGRGAGRCQ
jgi:hypothetical protein